MLYNRSLLQEAYAMDFYRLKYFVTTASYSSFSKAAENLYISRQALSKAIRRLEEECGAQLFVTGEGGVRLTEAGQHLLEEARPLIQSYDNFLTRWNERRGTLRQPLSIAMAQGVSLTLPADFFDTFRQREKQILLSIEEINTDAVLRLVEQEEFPIGLVGSLPAYLHGMEYRLLAATGIWLYVPADHSLAGRTALELSDIDGQRFITTGKNNHLHRFFLEHCQKAAVHPHIVLTTTQLQMMVRFIKDECLLSFGFSPKLLPLPSPKLQAIPLHIPDGDAFGTYAIKKQYGVLTPAAKQLWDYLAASDL